MFGFFYLKCNFIKATDEIDTHLVSNFVNIIAFKVLVMSMVANYQVYCYYRFIQLIYSFSNIA